MSAVRFAIVAGSLALAGCATSGGWMGAEAEKTYDKELEIKRLAEVLNNDDYYELERDGRLYVLSDAKEYRSLRAGGEPVYSTKKIGAGPGGKTLVYGLVKNEAKILETNPRAQGAAQKMFEGALQGMDKDFLGVVETPTGTYVFTSWKALQAFKASGNSTGFTESLGGQTLIYAGASARPADTAERVAKLYAP
jgi:hypothetical protein